MTDIIERLRIESRREPHEPIWRDAIDEIEALRAEVAEWKRVAAAQGEAKARDEALLRQALEALEFFRDTAICEADTAVATEAIAALRERLGEGE